MIQLEIAIPIETSLFARVALVGNPRRLSVVRWVLADRCEGGEPLPPVDVESLLEALLRLFGRQFGPLEKRMDGRRQMLRRRAHQPVDRTWAKRGRRSSGRPRMKPGSKTSRGSVSFLKLTGSWYQRRA